MESIGQNLCHARESKGLSVEQVARETNISRQYIQALESDRYDVFPGEPYVVGFLRNYGDFLGLDAEALVSQYRTLKIQEQPAPLEALIHKPNPWPQKMLFIAGAVVVAVIFLIFLVPSIISFSKDLPKMMAQALPNHQNKVYALTPDKNNLTERLYVGDSVNIAFGNQNYKYVLKSIGNDSILAGNDGEHSLKLGDNLVLDLDSNTSQDIKLVLRDVTPGQPDKGLELSVERLSQTPVTPSTGSVGLGDELAAGVPKGVNQMALGKASVVLEDVQAKPFSVDVVFRNYALLRYVVDDNLREENFFNKGQTIHIDASKKVQLWTSNAGSLATKVSGVDVDFGKNGEVSYTDLEWTKDPATGHFQLLANPQN